MNTQIQNFLYLFLFFALFSGSGFDSFAQEKKSKKVPAQEKTNAGGNGMADKVLPVAKEPQDDGKVKSSAESYSFIVFVNPTDEQAQEIWKTLPNKIPGMTIISSGVLAQANFIFSKNPEIALLKRAYGSYFQIFSREDLDTYKQSLPCFNDLDTEFKALLEKRIGQ
jgi:hypothetical protein